MNFGEAVGSSLRNYATFSGRARRSEFWYFILFNLLVNLVAGVLDAAFFDTDIAAPEQFGAFSLIAFLVLLLPGLAVSVRRLHDTGRSGWALLLALIPLVGIIILIVFYATRGEDGPNRFGPDPRMPAAGPGDGTPRPWQATPPSRPWQRP